MPERGGTAIGSDSRGRGIVDCCVRSIGRELDDGVEVEARFVGRLKCRGPGGAEWG